MQPPPPEPFDEEMLPPEAYEDFGPPPGPPPGEDMGGPPRGGGGGGRGGGGGPPGGRNENRVGGRILPQDVEAERAVLGSVLLQPEAMYEAIEQVDGPDFYRPAHRLIFEAMKELSSNSEPIDPITMSSHLKSRGELDQVGGAQALLALSEAVPTAANVRYYASIVRKKGMLRRLIESATEVVQKAFEATDPDQAVDAAEQAIFEVAKAKAKQGITPIHEIVASAFEGIEKLAQQRKAITGVPTGIGRLDAMLSGLQSSDLVIVAGRPSMGKTAFSIGMGLFAATEEHRRVAIFSLEMSKESLVQRMLCSEGRIDMSKLRGGFLNEDDWPKLAKAAGRISEAPLFIDDTGSISVLELRAKCRRVATEQKRVVELELRKEMNDRKARGEEVDEEEYRKQWESHSGLDLVIIDYLQLMRGSGNTQSREQEISEISRGLKGLAKELNIPVVALSQLNRGVEQRTDKRPGIADLRESGAIEQDADVIMFVYRDEVYNKETEERGVAEIIIGKQRNGPIGTAKCKFFHEFTRFDNLADDAHLGSME